MVKKVTKTDNDISQTGSNIFQFTYFLITTKKTILSYNIHFLTQQQILTFLIIKMLFFAIAKTNLFIYTPLFLCLLLTVYCKNKKR